MGEDKMTARKFKETSSISKPIYESWFELDRWHAKNIGLEGDTAHSAYYLNFSRIKQPWLKTAIKKFVLFQSTIKSFASCRSYTANLTHFSLFIEHTCPTLLPADINRKIIIDYFIYLNQLKLSTSTRHIAYIHFKTFHALVVQEKWLPMITEPLIFTQDMPKSSSFMPRYIPEYVIKQLLPALCQLPKHIENFVTLLLETGRRISEVCALPYHCLELDEKESVFLRVHDKKLKKHYLIPISKKCVDAIKKQQTLAMKIMQEKKGVTDILSIKFLFPTPSSLDKQSLYLRARHINRTLNQLALTNNIIDENGMLWHFHAHQFRHTLGTKMINSGVPQAIVQRYLGHQSPEMTARYAYIHQDTLKKSFQQFQTTLIDANGLHQAISADQQEAFLLKQHLMNQALPNGLCGLPLLQQRCPHANACLTCTHFRTHKGFLAQHETQLQETNRIIDEASTNGWQRQAEMNITVKKNLETIIARLKEENNHA